MKPSEHSWHEVVVDVRRAHGIAEAYCPAERETADLERKSRR
jgi:hypothetical protein